MSLLLLLRGMSIQFGTLTTTKQVAAGRTRRDDVPPASGRTA